MTKPFLRPATRDDDAAIRALFRTAFPDSPKADASVLAWQYWNNPFAPVRSWVWDDGGEVVSHYAGLPVPAQLAGTRGIAAIGVDAATAPSHRGQGLFEGIARAVYEDCGAHGIPVTMCFPNANSLRGFEKAGGLPIGHLRTYVLPFDDAWVAARFRIPRSAAALFRRVAFGSLTGPAASEVEQPPDDLDELWEVVSPGVRFGVTRDAAWWRWRYLSNPSVRYRYLEARRGQRLVGAIAVTTREAFGGRFVYILELLAADDDAARDLVRGLRQVADSAVGAAFATLADSAPAALARRAGLRPLPRRFEPKPLHFGIADNLGSHPEFARVPWSLAWGDLDHL